MWNEACVVYSPNAEKKFNEIYNARNLLEENGYVVIKLTKGMAADVKICEEADYEGDCLGCSCSKCVAGFGD